MKLPDAEGPGLNPGILHPWHAMAALLVLAGALYWQVVDFGFINLDDETHVFANPLVKSGFSFSNLVAAFTTTHASLWIPLTWISLMCDVTLFGMEPAWLHLVNVAFHLCNIVLLFLWLRLILPGWQTAWIISALFALHPINVESVAWITERKNVLCMFFMLLSLITHTLWVRSPTARMRWCCVGLFLCAVMAKPMAVPLPAVLLLLDYWPFRRWDGVRTWRLVLEKWPFFVVGLFSSLATLFASHGGETSGAIPLTYLGWDARLSNVLTSYGNYLRQLAWPLDLAILYQHGFEANWRSASFAAMILLVITLIAIFARCRAAYLIVGWLWFLGALIPTSGIVQVGGQSHADRFTYFAQLGLWIAVVMGFRDCLTIRTSRVALVMGGVLLVFLSFLSFITWRQVGFWKDTITLLERTVSAHPENVLAKRDLAAEYAKADRHRDAIRQYQSAINLLPTNAHLWDDMGLSLSRLGEDEKAAFSFARAARLDPTEARYLGNLGLACERLGRVEEAEKYLRLALAIKPDFAAARYRLGLLLVKSNPAAAREELSRAAALEPANATYRQKVMEIEHGFKP